MAVRSVKRSFGPRDNAGIGLLELVDSLKPPQIPRRRRVPLEYQTGREVQMPQGFALPRLCGLGGPGQLRKSDRTPLPSSLRSG